MQPDADKNNQKRENDVQIVSDEIHTEPLHNAERPPKKSRSKYKANPRLLELIEQANLLPPKFNFDWSKEHEKHGYKTAFSNWETALSKLSIAEHIKLLTAVLDERDEIFKGKVPTLKVTKKGLMKFSAVALDKANIIIEIRRFLKYLSIFYKVSQERELKDLVSDNQSVLEVWNNLFIDLDQLYEFSACRKYAQYLRDNFITVNERYRKGVIVYSTLRSIGLGEQEKFQCTDAESKKFYQAFIKSFLLKETSHKYASNLFVILDLLTEITFLLESKNFRTTVFIDKSGNVEFRASAYVEALEGVNISRLRLCEYCQRLFWANRKDAFTCSPKHSRNRRMRLLRESWQKSGHLYLNARKGKANKKKENNKNGNL